MDDTTNTYTEKPNIKALEDPFFNALIEVCMQEPTNKERVQRLAELLAFLKSFD